MTYGISETPSGLTITLAAKTRDELYGAAVKAALEAVYGGAPPAGESDGQTYPVQGAGLDDADMLRTLFDECFVAARRADGTLHPPRWLAFDEGRVTANLALSTPKTPGPAADARAPRRGRDVRRVPRLPRDARVRPLLRLTERTPRLPGGPARGPRPPSCPRGPRTRRAASSPARVSPSTGRRAAGPPRPAGSSADRPSTRGDAGRGVDTRLVRAGARPARAAGRPARTRGRRTRGPCASRRSRSTKSSGSSCCSISHIAST